MTGAQVLAAPLYELRDQVGRVRPSAGPAQILDRAHAELAAIASALRRSRPDGWTGRAATTAGDFLAGAAADAAGLAAQTELLGTAAKQADSAVARAAARLQEIIDRFEGRAAALAAHLDEPGVAEQLRAEAQRAIGEATAVVDELRAELDRQTATVSAPAVVPAGSSLGRGFSGGAPSTGSPGGWSGGGSDLPAALAAGDPPVAAITPKDPGLFGDGVAVRLPDGSTALAPNAVAASAVRHALTQLGVPYRWGGTTPGVGLDCSGLTQWAYHEAGLDIPRLAQEQDIGKAVPAGSLRPGDLAVWDGHVAMVVGPHTMIEAGDPVKLSAIRTTNAGQGFQGFWRPTA